MMLRSRRSEWLAAAALMAPFVAIYGVLFVYPTVKMIVLSFQNAPLIGTGRWIGFDNYRRLWFNRLFSRNSISHRSSVPRCSNSRHGSASSGRARCRISGWRPLASERGAHWDRHERMKRP